MVRATLELLCAILSSSSQKDVAELGKVHKRSTKMIKGLEFLSYEATFINVRLFTLEKDN